MADQAVSATAMLRKLHRQAMDLATVEVVRDSLLERIAELEAEVARLKQSGEDVKQVAGDIMADREGSL